MNYYLDKIKNWNHIKNMRIATLSFLGLGIALFLGGFGYIFIAHALDLLSLIILSSSCVLLGIYCILGEINKFLIDRKYHNEKQNKLNDISRNMDQCKEFIKEANFRKLTTQEYSKISHYLGKITNNSTNNMLKKTIEIMLAISLDSSGILHIDNDIITNYSEMEKLLISLSENYSEIPSNEERKLFIKIINDMNLAIKIAKIYQYKKQSEYAEALLIIDFKKYCKSRNDSTLSNESLYRAPNLPALHELTNNNTNTVEANDDRSEYRNWQSSEPNTNHVRLNLDHRNLDHSYTTMNLLNVPQQDTASSTPAGRVRALLPPQRPQPNEENSNSTTSNEGNRDSTTSVYSNHSDTSTFMDQAFYDLDTGARLSNDPSNVGNSNRSSIPGTPPPPLPSTPAGRVRALLPPQRPQPNEANSNSITSSEGNRDSTTSNEGNRDSTTSSVYSNNSDTSTFMDQAFYDLDTGTASLNNDPYNVGNSNRSSIPGTPPPPLPSTPPFGIGGAASGSYNHGIFNQEIESENGELPPPPLPSTPPFGTIHRTSAASNDTFPSPPPSPLPNDSQIPTPPPLPNTWNQFTSSEEALGAQQTQSNSL